MLPSKTLFGDIHKRKEESPTVTWAASCQHLLPGLIDGRFGQGQEGQADQMVPILFGATYGTCIN